MSDDPAVVTLPFPRAKVLLEDLAGGVAGKCVHDLDTARTLELRQPLAREADELPLGDRGVGLQPHDCLDHLAPRRVGTPMTATSATAGCSASTRSTSGEYTFSPPEMIMSFS